MIRRLLPQRCLGITLMLLLLTVLSLVAPTVNAGTKFTAADPVAGFFGAKYTAAETKVTTFDFGLVVPLGGIVYGFPYVSAGHFGALNMEIGAGWRTDKFSIFALAGPNVDFTNVPDKLTYVTGAAGVLVNLKLGQAVVSKVTNRVHPWGLWAMGKQVFTVGPDQKYSPTGWSFGGGAYFQF